MPLKSHFGIKRHPTMQIFKVWKNTECWTIRSPLYLPVSSATTYIPQYGLLPQLPAGIAADRKGRRSSDVTVDYIRTPEAPTFAISRVSHGTTQWRRISGETKARRRTFAPQGPFPEELESWKSV
ncbi:hypothetical protein AMECASPLE_017302 [Ameca splendens]|uniref:Uncharacterized protein n=1 Tax=Ameca splendens TaxID=208324 RepID=A0ABV0Z1V9_9TELE